MDPRPLLDDVVRITTGAASAIAAYFRSGAAVWDKGDGHRPAGADADDPLTEADLRAHHILTDGLGGLTPGLPVWSEEGAAPTADATRFWLVDPLDGTREFVNGVPEFSVSVAFVEDGRPVLGVVLNPITGDLHAVARGQGVQCRWGEAGPPRIPRGGQRPIALVSRTEHRRGESGCLGDAVEPYVIGSTAWKLALLSGGAGDVYVTPNPRHPWDLAAGVLLAESAGFRCTDGRGAPLSFAPGAPLPSGVLAARAPLHTALLPMLARALRS